MAVITVKDGNGNPITFVVTEVGSDKIPHHVMVGLDADGTTARVLKLNANRELIVNLANTSLAVTGTFFQATQPVSAASLPLPTGAATQATLAQISSAYWADGATPTGHRFALLAGIDPDGNVQAIATDLTGRFLAPAGQATEAKQDTANASLGATTEGAAASDTATSGLVGLFKRLLQRVTTLLGVLPGSLGSKNSANSFPVVVASDQGAVPVSGSVSVSGLATGTDGVDLFGLVSAANINATVVKASPGRVFMVAAANNGAAPRYLKLYDKSTTPAPATDTSLLRGAPILLPAGGGQVFVSLEGFKGFTAGISFAITAGIAAADATAINANEVTVNIGYK